MNRVLFGGVPALIQRWDSDVVEVKVPFKAQTGPVQVLIGKKKLAVGIFRSSIRKLFPFTLPPSNLAMIEIVGEHFGITAGPRDPNTMFGVNDVIGEPG